MRTRRFLLLTTALSAAAGVEACGKDDVIHGLPGNPKGMSYEDGGSILPTATPPPGKPQGSPYDAGRSDSNDPR